jgi:glutamine---fructose-6-phosphate transaminase (isomerizing)
MCGIIGILGHGDVSGDLVESLRRLAYRGYDSAGIAVLGADGLDRRRAVGKVAELDALLRASPLPGPAGIGHTRWATHGVPSVPNAHPIRAGRVALVHNGIIENFKDLREELTAAGEVFESDTDTETIAKLIARAYDASNDPVAAVRQTLPRLRGAFAFVALFADQPDMLIGARLGSPMAVGIGDNARYFGSDAVALGHITDRLIYLEEGDWAVVTRSGHQVYDRDNRAVDRPISIVPPTAAAAEKGNYRHFMQKEIHEAPDACARTGGHYVDALAEAVIPIPDFDFAGVDRLLILACGTAHYAGAIAEYWFEQIARLPTETDIASEFRYRDPPLDARTAAIFVSQSGETADTLAALRLCKANGVRTLALVNVSTSTMAREADIALPTFAGVEIGVASTKAFIAQLTALAAIAIAAGKARRHVDAAREAELVRQLNAAPALLAKVLKSEELVIGAAETLVKARDVLYIGRGGAYPLALEGALKLKEISYIHAEGYAAGELKHGPIALVDEVTPIVAIAPHDALMEKTISNIKEVEARKGRVLLLSDAAGIALAGSAVAASIEAPPCAPFIAPIVYAPLVHMLAYHVAVLKGTDVDQPRNLAKAVTVE